MLANASVDFVGAAAELMKTRADFSFEECLNLAFLRAFNNGGQLFNKN